MTPASDRGPRRGDIWLADLDKVRPVIVLTRDPVAGLLNKLIAAPVTTVVRRVASEVPLGPSDGISRASVANMDNLQLVERSALIRRVGRLATPKMAALCRALAFAVGCD